MCVVCLLCSYKNRPPSERRLLVLLFAAILLSIALIIALAVLSFHCKWTPRSKHTYQIACEMSRTRMDSHSLSQTIKYFSRQNKAIHFQTFKSVLIFRNISEFLLRYYINLLKPSGFFPYHQVWQSKILQGARFALSVLYGSQNRHH